jgi:glyceraldehyde 3-phosphate dehydrogenase
MDIARTADPEPLRIALMGFGRIGRNLFRILYQRDDLRIAAISDTADHEALEYLLRFDTLFGRFPDEISVTDGWLYAGGRRTRMLSAADPGDADWAELGVHTVVEATSAPRSRAELERHLDRGARRVILCAPPIDPPDLTVVIGVNDHRLAPEHRIVSNASCTAHCAAPVLKLLDETFGVRRAFVTTAHAYSNKNRLADVPAEDVRRGRAAAENIIPQETAAAEVIGELLPNLAGRLTAASFNVPVPNGSVVDLVCWHEQPVSREAINELIRTAAGSERWRGVLDYEDEPIVSSDIVRSPFSSTFDSLATMVLGERTSKTLAWYDNGWGYAHRVVDLIERFRELDEPGEQGRAA